VAVSDSRPIAEQAPPGRRMISARRSGAAAGGSDVGDRDRHRARGDLGARDLAHRSNGQREHEAGRM